MKRTPWLGNGDGHVYEHCVTPPERRGWGPLDCPSFVRVEHPENWPAPSAHGRPVGNRKVKNASGVRQDEDAPRVRRRRETSDERARRILRDNAPLVHRSRGE